MIIGTELRGWLGDRAGQRRSRIDAEAFATTWNDGAHHHAFAAAIASVGSCNAEAVAAAVRPLFADEAWIHDLIESLSAALRRDSFFEPPFRHINSDIHRGLVVYEDDLASIAVGVTDISQLAAKKCAHSGRGSIIFSGQLELFKFVKAGGARLSFWSAPPITAGFSAATAGRCEPSRERPIIDGEILKIDGRHESFVIEHAIANLLVLQATVKPDRAPVGVEYDAATREYAGCSAADDSASRIQMITTLLPKLGCADVFPAIAEFVDHPDFFVRWHVMRELLGLDAGAALPHLKRMAARDPHPETRRAARSVLDRIEGAMPSRRKAA